MELAPAVRLYGRRGSPQAYAIRDYLQRSDIPFEWVELRDNEQARDELGLDSVDDARLPICIFPDGTRMERPTVRQVTEKLGWFRNPSRSEYDVAIYGAGPAGLSAAGLCRFRRTEDGGDRALRHRRPSRHQPEDRELSRLSRKASAAPSSPNARASRPSALGPRFCIAPRRRARGVLPRARGVGYLDDGTKIVARVSVCATGVEYRRLGPAERRSAVWRRRLLRRRRQRGLTLQQRARDPRRRRQFLRPGLAAPCPLRREGDHRDARRFPQGNVSEYLVDRIQTTPNIEVLPNTEVAALHGDDLLRAVTLRNLQTGEERAVETSFALSLPRRGPEYAMGREVGIARDEEGYLVTGPDLRRVRPHCRELDSQPRALLSRDQHAGRVRSRRRAPCLDQANAVGRRRRRHGRRLCASLSGGWLGRFGRTTMQCKQRGFRRGARGVDAADVLRTVRAGRDSDPHWPYRPRHRLRRVEPRAQDLPCRPCSARLRPHRLFSVPGHVRR